MAISFALSATRLLLNHFCNFSRLEAPAPLNNNRFPYLVTFTRHLIYSFTFDSFYLLLVAAYVGLYTALALANDLCLSIRELTDPFLPDYTLFYSHQAFKDM